MKKLSLLIILLVGAINQIMAHSVQIAYCVDCNGNLRIFVEHWHGSANPNSTTMTIQLSVNGQPTVQTTSPLTSYINVPFGSLPGCITPITSVAGCPGSANQYNDWVVYDYTNLPTGVPIAFTIISGNNAFTADCGGMYPLTVNFTIPPNITNGSPITSCQGGQTPLIPVPNGVGWTNNNTAIGLPASGTGPIPPFTTNTLGTAIISYANGCGVFNTTLTVIPALSANFSNTSGSGVCLGTAVNFNNTSTSSSTGWLWNFGDGNTSNLQNPSHVYAAPGTYTVTQTISSGTSCPGTATQVVTVNPFPVLAYTVTPACANANVTIANTSSISSGSINYNFSMPGGNPNTSTATNPVYTYSTGGTYTVTLTGTSNNNCVSTLTKTVTILASPIANFTTNYTPCTTASLTATSTSSINGGTSITGYNYNWNDGTPNTLTNPASHTFAASGQQTITLIVTNASGCTSTITNNVYITQKPIANFTFAPQCFGAPINFTNTSTAGSGVNSYTWTYGNTFSSNAVSPSYNYPASGTYTVALYAINSDLCKDSIKKTVNVYGRPVLAFTPNAICFNTPTTFSNLTTTTVNANTGTIATYSWNFGATAGSSTLQNPVYTYTNPANATANTTYTVDLTTTTSNGCVDVLTNTVMVYSLPTPTFVADSACKFFATTMTNVGTNNGNPYYLFNWDFNNDNIADASSINPTTTFVFPNFGNNNVTYTVITSPNGGALQCKSVFNKNVWVHASPAAAITNTNVCSGALIGLSGVTSTINMGTIANYAWQYGNGTNSLVNATPSTSVMYNPSGVYSVSLTVTSAVGCTNTAVKTVTLFGRSVIDFTPDAICFNTPTTFTNLTSTSINANTGAVASWSWNFGATSGSSTLQNPINTYTNPANATANITYSATLFATTFNGCKDSLTKTVTVYSLPTATFVADSVCFGSPTTLTNVGNNNGNPYYLFNWDFNADNIADVSAVNPVATNIFTVNGNNAVTYTVLTSPNSGLLQCKQVFSKNIWIFPIPVASITHTNSCIDTQPLNMSGINSSVALGTINNYAWNYGTLANNNSLTNPTPVTSFSYNTAANYVVTLTVTTNGGCKHIDTTVVEVWERPYGSFTYSKNCLNKRMVLTGQQAQVSGHIAIYDWDVNLNPSTVEITGAVVHHTYTPTAGAGTHTVNMLMMTDKGCKNMYTGTVYVNYIPVPKFYAPKRAGCTDLCITILDSTAALTGPAKNSSWSWNFGNGQTATGIAGASFNQCYKNESHLDVQNYDVSLIVRSDSGCVDSIIKRNFITVYPKPVASFNWEGEDGTILVPKVNFTNTSIGATNFQWAFSDVTNEIDSINQNPSHFFKTDAPDTYNVFLAIRNQYGCKDTTMKPVDIGPNYTFYVPNAFTPNGDGKNEVFTGKGIGVKSFKMWIYDRWGEMLAYTEDIVKGWDGSVKGNQIDTKSDVFQYKIIVSDLKNKQHEYVGHVTLIK